MSDTQPYAAISPDLVAVDADARSDEAYIVELDGRLFLQPGGEPRVLKIFDDHPELASVMRVTFDGVELRRPFIEVDARRWARLRRGLLLCASYAVTGKVVVARRGAWRLAIEACGEPAQPQRSTTAKLTGRRRRLV